MYAPVYGHGLPIYSPELDSRINNNNNNLLLGSSIINSMPCNNCKLFLRWLGFFQAQTPVMEASRILSAAMVITGLVQKKGYPSSVAQVCSEDMCQLELPKAGLFRSHSVKLKCILQEEVWSLRFALLSWTRHLFPS